MVIVLSGGAIVSLPFPTKISAHRANAIGGFGLVTAAVTIPYHLIDLGQTLPRVAFTNTYHRGDRLVLCAGYDGDLCHVAGMIWPTVITNELFSICYGMEVAGVLCETLVGCLGVHNSIEAVRHAHLHGLIDS